MDNLVMMLADDRSEEYLITADEEREMLESLLEMEDEESENIFLVEEW